MSELVRFDVDGQVATLTLDNPPLNIITNPMRPLIMDVLKKISADDSIRCLIITGAGDRAFCAGADLGEEAELTPETVRRFLEDDSEIFDGLEQLEVPVIAAINGHCMGGGLEVALSCDLRVAADDAKFRGAGVTVGLVVSTTRLTRLLGPAVASDLLLTGRTFTGAEAFRLRVVSDSVARGEVLAAARRWADEIASRAPLAVRRTKLAIAEASDLSYQEAMSREFDHFAALSSTRDHKHAIEAFFKREKPEFRGE